MVEYDLGLVVGSDGAKGDKGDKGDKGAKGDAGKGITSIQKTSSSGKVDTYTITYSDGSTSTFTVTNGSDASVTVDSSLSSTSTNPVQNKVIKTALDTKSDSSHNHDSRYYTETEMDTKLSGKANTSHTHNISDVSNLQSALDGKADDSDIPTKTSDLTNDGDGTNPFLTQHQSLASKTVTVEKQATAESGYFATYVIKQNNAQVGSKINIPKDYLVKSGSVKTCSTANVPVSGYKVGDKYIDFVVNTKDSSGTDEHIYILVSDLVDVPVDWSDIENKPSSFTPSSHNHTASDITDFPSIPTKTSDLTNDSGFLTSHQDITGKEDNSNKVSSWSSTTNNTRYPSEKLVKDSLDGKANSSHTHTKSQITDFPTIPSKISDLTNDSDFIEKSSTTGLVKNDGTIDTTAYLSQMKVGSSANYLIYTTSNGVLASKQKLGNINYLGRIGSTSGLPLKTGANGVIETGSFGTSSGTFAEGNHTHSEYVNPVIVDNLTTDDATKVLSAKQGKVLNDLIDAKSDFSGSYADLTNVPSTFPPSSHTHTVSNITNFPSIPSKTSDLTNDGADGTNIFVSNNDNRLSDNRNPLLNQLSATSTNPLDLNDVTDTGFYALLSNTSIQYVSNLPSSWGATSFYLVSLYFNDTYCIQFLVSYDYAKSYVRVKMGNGWNAWRSYLSSDNVVDNLNSTSSTSVLSARQGKVLGDLIGDAITYINQ